MNLSIIRKKIKTAVEHEERTDSLAKLIKEAVDKSGQPTTIEAARQMSLFVKEYVNLVPKYISEGKKASSQLGIKAEMDGMLAELEQYWIEENDLIPDWKGLIGITDDAYASLYLLQSMSAICQQGFGRTIINGDLSKPNTIIRSILGNETATTLEQKVQYTIGINMAGNFMNNMFQNILNSNFAFSNPFGGFTNQYEMDRQIDVQLGSMGVI